MQPLANKFIELLESKQLLSDEVIDELRRHLAESKAKLSPELLAKLLVDNGHLTKFQATKLVAELAQDGPLRSPSTAGAKPVANDELGLAPPSRVAEVVLDDDEVVEVEPVDVVASVVTARPAAKPPAIEIVDSVEVVEVVEAIPAVDFAARSPLSSASPLDVAPAPARPVKVPKSKANPWDSFRILGIGTLVILVFVVGGFLINWFLRGSAEDAIKRADDLYQQRSYETAQSAYSEFSRNWPAHKLASYAKVRSALAALRRDVETGTNPVNGWRTADEILPTIENEAGLVEQQADLTGVLVTLAEKFNTKMDQVKETDQRKELMAEMEKLMKLINESKYVGSTQRAAQAPTLQKIEESKARIIREISRDDDLVSALKEIDTQLENKEVLKAYETRKQLISRYPLLEANEEVVKRVRLASDIQRQLVQDASSSPRIAQADAGSETVKSFLLANRDGGTVGELEGTVIYYRVKGSIYAIDAGKGEVLWNRYVGLGLDSHPVRLADAANPDVLVTEVESGKLHRLIGSSGQSKWSLDFAEPIHVPVVEGEEVVVSTHSGSVYCLDAVSGQTKWAKRVPQRLSVAACLAIGKQTIYQPAEHSNIYVLDRRDGTCKEVFYLGHRPGAFRISPVWHKGLLFLVDNFTSNACKVRVLQPSENGLQRVDNDRLLMDGNVISPPAIDRQQMLVQSDLGNALILDVEPTSTNEKVSNPAKIAKNFDSPHLTWAAFANNFVWLADDRLARFDYVVSTGNLNRKWIQNEGDQFVGPLQLFGKTLVHARKLKGNQGVRVSGVSADDGSRIWEVDLGEPVALITKKQQGGYAAITTGANYFSVAGKSITARADVVAGEGKAQKWFDDPLWLSPTQAVMLNRSNPREFALYSDSNTPLQVLAVPFGSASPSGPAILARDKVVVGLDNGQLVMFDPTTGRLVGTPHQAAMTPNTKVVWNRPLFVPASGALIVANDQKQIVRLDASQSLRQLSNETLEVNLVGPLALVGSQVVAVKASQAGDELVAFNSTSLASTAGMSLDGKLTAGPFSGEQYGILQTESRLVAFDGNGKIVWAIPFPVSQIVGEPVLSNGKLLIANRVGQLWVIDATSGQVSGSASVGQSLHTTPLELDKGRILIGTSEGSILATTIPTTHSLSGAVQ